MSEQDRKLIYACGDWRVHLGRRELASAGVPVPIGARAFEIFEVLVRSANDMVSKDDLMNCVWPAGEVGYNTLQVHISAIRKALGPDRGMLATTGRGYRLLGDWTVHGQEATARPALRPTRVGGGTPARFPAAVTQLIGRLAAVRRVRDLVSAYRVVTLTGPGGIGKTTLALEVARGLVPNYDDGGAFVELAALSDPDLVPSSVASALGLNISGETISADAVARAIGARNVLLVLDNCEHVIDAAASLIERLARLCPRTTVLATSREVLRIQGEHIYRVPPLEVPAVEAADPDHILGHGAVELFVARANALESDLASRADDLALIAAICRRLDGIPLAIEFAAARAATLGIQQVAMGLGNRFALLTDGRRTALPRHRTLRAALDWSYALLPEAERLLLRRLAIFPAGFTLDAAVAVMRDTAPNVSAALDGIGNLAAKSLVAMDKPDMDGRWSLLETIRAYALEKLVEHAEVNSAARQHAEHFRDLFALPASGPRSRLSNELLTRRAREIDNIRAALDWSFAPEGDLAIAVHLTAAYAPVWLHLSLIGECQDRCQRALVVFDTRPELSALIQMELQIALGSTLIVTLGSPEQAESVLTRALATADKFHEPDAQARALAALSSALIYRGNHDGAHAALQRLKQVADQIDDPGIIAVADRRVGTRLLTAGRLRAAQDCFERILRSPMPAEDRRPEFWNYLDARAMARAMLARTLCLRGFAESAHREAQASVAEVRDTDHPLSICRVLNFGMCRIAVMTGDFAVAEQAIAHSIEVATRLNAPFWRTVGQFLEGKLLVERGEFARGVAVLEDAFATCGRAGWRISYPEFKGAHAAGYAGLGQIAEALSAVDDAIAKSGPHQGQMWYFPELLRIKGELLLRADPDRFVSIAEDCLNQAAEMAREQDALFWELRVALGLARVRMSQGRHEEARRILAPVRRRFTEDLATTDLRAAQALLEALGS